MRYFRLRATIEMDMPWEEFGERQPARLEILQAIDEPSLFRCRFWLVQHYRVQSSFPQEPPGFPSGSDGDEPLLSEASILLGFDKWNQNEFQAESVDSAVRHALGLVEEAAERGGAS